MSVPPKSSSAHDDLPSAALDAVEGAVQRIGRELFADFREPRSYVWNRSWWDERLMAFSMRDEEVKTQLFRYVDVLPALRTPEAILSRLAEYLGEVRNRLPPTLVGWLDTARALPLVRGGAARLVQAGAADFAKKFIAGANAKEVTAAALKQRALGRAFTLDILGEAVITETEAESHARDYCDLIEAVGPIVNAQAEIAAIDRAEGRELPRLNVSIKLSALDPGFEAIDPAGVLDRAGARLREILRTAKRQRAFINVDMESYAKKDLTLHIVRTILSEPEFRERDDIGLVIQCYLRDSASDLTELRDWATQRGTPIGVRLVKGAYWDYETVHAAANGWPVPVFQRKWESDAQFERLTRFALRNLKSFHPAIASHNLRSIAHAYAAAEHFAVPCDAYEFQMLYGMADPEKSAITSRNSRLRIYMPFGELIPGMAYLVRRLLENTSNNSFLRAGMIEHRPIAQLLKRPEEAAPRTSLLHPEEPNMSATASLKNTFANHAPVDFSREESRRAMQRAIDALPEQFGKHYPLMIDGAAIDTVQRITSIDPSLTSRTLGTSASAEKSHVESAVQAALRAAGPWRRFGVVNRAECLNRAAEHLERRFFEFAAWLVYEAGKTWREATTETEEAIDFLRYYAQRARELQSPHGADVPGEENRFEYLPRGVVGVIAPWNFPLAILTGMTAAALSVGNTVIMKPAEQTPVIAAKLFEIFNDSGFPPGVVNYLPGAGEVAGAALTEHERVAMIVFTGSRAVGLAINARAAALADRAEQVKRVVAEMGGKNAIIIDSDADLDEAVLGTVNSAFAFQGQKCSACSRAIVHADVYDAFLARLVEAAKTKRIGPPSHPGTDLGPVIDEESLRRIESYIKIARTEGREVLAIAATERRSDGFYIGPHIYADVSPKAKISQEEIFGPVLAVIRAASFEEALKFANDTPYALTGGVFSRSPANLDRARAEFQVGNLYLNRGITGAIVARQPFGGFKMSGIGTKAGGPDYLQQFTIPRVVTENTLRRGFTPPQETT